ncbi:MAG: hypothetical protein Q7S47_01375 [bacterium]|nr:hypothetical protein [bacterium]
MIYTILSLLMIISASFFIFKIIGRHARILASIDIDSIPAERQSAIKDAIIASRIKRRIVSVVELSALISEPAQRVLKFVQKNFRLFHGNIMRLRAVHHSRRTIGGARISSPENLPLPERIELLMQEAASAHKEERMKDAEKKYIDVLSLDLKYIAAYDGLRTLYSEQKEWGQACEVAQHVCRLRADELKRNPDDSDTHERNARYSESLHDLSDLYCNCGYPADALKTIRKALALQENNPKYLDALIDIYVVLQMRLKAEKTLEQLRKVNPENQKLHEKEAHIAQLSY